jgi:hypothetical protein
MFKDGYREHIQAIRTNKQTNKPQNMLHIYLKQDTYGTTENTTEISQIKKKGHLLNTLERSHIYKLSSNKLQTNDIFVDLHNPIFNLSINNPHYNIHSQKPLPHPSPPNM